MSASSAQATDRRRRRGSIPPAFTAAALSGHSAVGLAFGALIYLVCLTGTLSVFVDEFKLIEQPLPGASAPAPGALDHAIARVAARSPGGTIYALAPTTPRQRLTLTASGPGGGGSWIADVRGDLTPARTPWTDFVTQLHMTLTAPAPWGSLVVGLVGAALLCLIASGVLSHPRIFRDAFRLKLSGSRRLREAELHNRLSVWGLPFHVAVTLTGALFGLAGLTASALTVTSFHGDAARALAPLTGPPVAADPRPDAGTDVEALVVRTRMLLPGSRLSYVGVERAGTRGARYTVEVTAPGRLPRGEQAYYDAGARLLGRGRFATGSLGLQLYSAAAQVHFGFFGGLPVRAAYGVLGLAQTYVAATGVSIWLARRRDRGLASPRLEAAWAAVTWGAPFALGVAAALSRLAPTVVFWTSLAGAQALGWLWPTLLKHGHGTK